MLFAPSNVLLGDKIILVVAYGQKSFTEERYIATQKNAVVGIVF